MDFLGRQTFVFLSGKQTAMNLSNVNRTRSQIAVSEVV